jgi:hypothetical protein
LKTALTTGAIARELGESIYRVQYAVRTRGIESEAVAGNLRIFPPEAVKRIAGILHDIDSQRDRRSAVARQTAVMAEGGQS